MEQVITVLGKRKKKRKSQASGSSSEKRRATEEEDDGSLAAHRVADPAAYQPGSKRDKKKKQKNKPKKKKRTGGADAGVQPSAEPAEDPVVAQIAASIQGRGQQPPLLAASAAPLPRKAQATEEGVPAQGDDSQPAGSSVPAQNDTASLARRVKALAEAANAAPPAAAAAQGGGGGGSDAGAQPGKSFEELGVVPELCQPMAAMGWKLATPIQCEALPYAFAGRDIIGLAETGSGKTGAFGIPIIQALLREPQKLFALVLAPTRELAFQISEQLEAIGAQVHTYQCHQPSHPDMDAAWHAGSLTFL
jgi:hypothetical protein